MSSATSSPRATDAFVWMTVNSGVGEGDRCAEDDDIDDRFDVDDDMVGCSDGVSVHGDGGATCE